MNAIAGELTQKDKKGSVPDPADGKTLGNDTTGTDVSKSGSCMEVHGDEEWMRDYKEYQMEEEDMGDRVMINQEEDITKKY